MAKKEEDKNKVKPNPELVKEVGVASAEESANAKAIPGKMEVAKPSELVTPVAKPTATQPEHNAYGDKVDSHSALARATVSAREKQQKATNEANDRKLNALRTIGTITSVGAGIGNMIGAINGAKPVEQDQSLLNSVQKGYADELERRRKEAQANMDAIYKAKSQDLKDAKAERESQAKRDAKITEMNLRFEQRLKEQQLRQEARNALELFKQTKRMEYLQEAKRLQRELELYKQVQINARSNAGIESRDANAEADRDLRRQIENARAENDYGKDAVQIPKETKAAPTSTPAPKKPNTTNNNNKPKSVVIDEDDFN